MATIRISMSVCVSVQVCVCMLTSVYLVCECVCVQVCVFVLRRACTLLMSICIHHITAIYILMDAACITQDMLSRGDLNKMVSVVEMMIENHNELFEVPQQVQLPAREYLKKKRSGEVRMFIYFSALFIYVCTPKNCAVRL